MAAEPMALPPRPRLLKNADFWHALEVAARGGATTAVILSIGYLTHQDFMAVPNIGAVVALNVRMGLAQSDKVGIHLRLGPSYVCLCHLARDFS
eukprot:6188645-Pleurochrysis_carterae.AAC.1